MKDLERGCLASSAERPVVQVAEEMGVLKDVESGVKALTSRYLSRCQGRSPPVLPIRRILELRGFEAEISPLRTMTAFVLNIGTRLCPIEFSTSL